MSTDLLMLLIIYANALFMLVWYYFDKAHFDNVQYMIDKTYERNIEAINRGCLDDASWVAFNMWDKSRGWLFK
jgi:hypothetical protein